MTINELKSEAKSRGIRWADVVDAYRGLRSIEAETRSYDQAIRERVWQAYAYTSNCYEFWRHGMQVRFPHAFAEGDRDSIYGWDDVAQCVACEFPEFAREGDPGEAVWEYIVRDYVRKADAADLYREALEMVANAATSLEFEAVPF